MLTSKTFSVLKYYVTENNKVQTIKQQVGFKPGTAHVYYF